MLINLKTTGHSQLFLSKRQRNAPHPKPNLNFPLHASTDPPLRRRHRRRWPSRHPSNIIRSEQHNKIGGSWIYDASSESDPLGLDPTRTKIHSSIYASLRTNLPREVMGFRDYPFVAKKGPHRDPRRFPGHWEVLEYLKDFTTEFGLSESVRFGAEVRRVGLEEGGKWKIRSRMCGEEFVEVYDAVVVCNGHYTEPRIAEIPGELSISNL